MKGRKRKPVAVRKLEGNPGKREIPREPVYPPDLPAPPKWVTGEALREWKRLGPMLVTRGVVTAADWGMLATYCESWGRAGELLDALRAMKRAKLFGQPAYLSISRELDRVRKQWFKAASELGLSPVTRSKVAVAKEEPKKAELLAFDGGKKA